MIKLTTYLSFFIGLSLLWSPFPAHAAKAKTEEQPIIQAPYAVVINADTGEVLYNKNAHHKAYPASITKLMTVLLLEKHMKDNETITASPKAVAQDPSNWYYRMHLGEKMSKQDALNALMIISSNDVAMAVAEHIGGSESGFAKMMNAEAQQLGLKDTHFVTPNGLHDPNHYTSPYDMALIAKEDLKYPDLIKAMQTKTYTIHTDQQTATIYRRDKIYSNPLAFGGKTGFTDQAGQTIVEYEKQGNKRIIVCLMKDNNYGEYPDVKAISTFAINRIKTMHVGNAGDFVKAIKLKGGKLPVHLTKTLNVAYAEGDTVKKTFNWVSLNQLDRGVKKGGKVGTLSVSVNGQIVQQATLAAAESYQPSPVALISKAGFSDLQKGLYTLTVLGILVLGFFILKPRNIKRNRLFDQNSD